MNVAVNHRQEHRKHRVEAAIVLVCLLASFQSASAQNSMPAYGQPQIPITANGQPYQYQSSMPPSQPLTARTQLDQEFGNNQYQAPLTTVQQQQQQQQLQAQNDCKRKKKKGHPFLHKLGDAAEGASSVAVRTAGTAARVAMPMTMMMMMNRSMYGSGYGYSPSYMYSYMPYMGYRMLAPY
jgi:hypothetical protein